MQFYGGLYSPDGMDGASNLMWERFVYDELRDRSMSALFLDRSLTFFGVVCSTLESVVKQARTVPNDRTASGTELLPFEGDEIETDLVSLALDGTVAPLANAAMKSPSKFLECTNDIATLLFESSDRRISSGAVAILLYGSPQFPQTKRFLAILKLDPADGFHPVEKKDAKGNVYVVFEKVEKVVPPTGEKLLKCAFVRPSVVASQSADYDLVVLDRQKSSSEEPAHFFIEKFLGADFFGNSIDMTEKFYATSLRIVDKLRNEIGNSKAEVVRGAITSAITTGLEIDVDQWVGNLNIKKTAKDTMLNELVAVIPDRAFTIDQDLASRLTKKRVFKGGYGFKLTINSADFGKVVVDRTTENGYEKLVLHVPELHEVER